MVVKKVLSKQVVGSLLVSFPAKNKKSLDGCWCRSWLSRTSLGGWSTGGEGDGGDDEGDEESGKGEPGESAGSLEQSALVGGSVKERLVDVVLVSARVDSESRGESNSTGESEKHEKTVDWGSDHLLTENWEEWSGGNGENPEEDDDSEEDLVVDCRGGVAVVLGDDGRGEGEDQDSAEELESEDRPVDGVSCEHGSVIFGNHCDGGEVRACCSKSVLKKAIEDRRRDERKERGRRT